MSDPNNPLYPLNTKFVNFGFNSQGLIAGRNPKFGWSQNGFNIEQPYIYCNDQQANNVSGGAAVIGINNRTLTNIVLDTHGLGSLAASVLTIPAGTWYCRAVGPVFGINRTRLQIWNNSDAANLILGPSEFTDAANLVSLNTRLQGIFTITASKGIRVRQWCQAARAVNGLGVASNSALGNEIYTELELWKLG